MTPHLRFKLQTPKRSKKTTCDHVLETVPLPFLLPLKKPTPSTPCQKGPRTWGILGLQHEVMLQTARNWQLHLIFLPAMWRSCRSTNPSNPMGTMGPTSSNSTCLEDSCGTPTSHNLVTQGKVGWSPQQATFQALKSRVFLRVCPLYCR